MKILKQFGVIFGVCWISLVIEHYLSVFFSGECNRYDFIVALSADRVLKD